MLERSAIPIGNIFFYDSTVESEWSELTDFKNEPYVVKYPTEELFEQVRAILFTSGGKKEKEIAFEAKKYGIFSIYLTSTSSEFEEIPPIVDGINHDLIQKNLILANPHPVSIMLSLIIYQLMTKYEIENISSVAFQPVSEYQNEGIEELINQTFAILNATSIPKKVFKEQRAFNLIPDSEENGRKILRELEKILKIKCSTLTFIKAPIFHCFAIITFLTIHGNPSHNELESLFKKNTKFKVFDSSKELFPTPISVAGKDGIFIKLMKNMDFPSRYTIWSVADNFRSVFVENAINILKRIATKL
ncbi:MAG: Asd/ArgC dimerization domain-containing protein [Candidatus Aminicenantia bacterium]